MTGPDEHNLELTYPRTWRYQVIGADEALLREAIACAVAECAYTVTVARSSRTGQYHSLHVELVVIDEAHRNGVFEALRRHDSVRFVL